MNNRSVSVPQTEKKINRLHTIQQYTQTNLANRWFTTIKLFWNLPDIYNGNPVKKSSSIFDQSISIANIHKPGEKTWGDKWLLPYSYSCHDHLTICIATMNSIFSDGVHMAQTVIYSTQLINCSSSLENSLNKQGNVKKILLFWYIKLYLFFFNLNNRNASRSPNIESIVK